MVGVALSFKTQLRFVCLTPSFVIIPVHLFHRFGIHFPQVTKANISLMKKLVMNGADTHPGANFVEQRKEGIKK